MSLTRLRRALRPRAVGGLPLAVRHCSSSAPSLSAHFGNIAPKAALCASTLFFRNRPLQGFPAKLGKRLRSRAPHDSGRFSSDTLSGMKCEHA